MENWGYYRRRVESWKPTMKGARFPIKWTEEVENTWWKFQGWVHIPVLVEPNPPIQCDAVPLPESATYAMVDIPTWVQMRERVREHWTIAGPGKPEIRWKAEELPSRQRGST